MFDALSTDRLRDRAAALAPLAIALAGGLVAWQLVRLTWLLLAGPTLPPPESASLPPLPVANSTQPVAVSLSRWHLFGNPGGAVDLAQLARQAPATPLRLTLRGTFNEDGPEGGYAIISDESGAHRRYRVGDRLPGDAELLGIYAGRVLLRRAGIDESLSLPVARAEGAGAGAAPGLQGAAPAAALPGAQAGAPAPFVNPNLSFGTPSLESIRAATGTDVAELARQVSVLPVLENGRFAGVRLSVGRDSDLLDRAGLKPSDVITAVNGIPLDGPERGAELLTTLRGARQVMLTVRRDGQSLQLPVGL